jgi:hypothetical protein
MGPENLAHMQDRTPNRPARSKCLYRLWHAHRLSFVQITLRFREYFKLHMVLINVLKWLVGHLEEEG